MHTNILLVESKSGIFSTWATTLKEKEFQITYVNNIKNAIETMSQMPLLALVIVDEILGREKSIELIKLTRESHPNIPILWITNQDLEMSTFDTHKPDVILNSATIEAKDICTQAEDLLFQYLYPKNIVDMIKERTVEVLANGFQVKATSKNAYLKGNYNVLAPVSAIITFIGKKISGWIVISGAKEHLEAIFCDLVPGHEAGAREAEDVAGEIANQSIGRIKEFFVAGGVPFKIASPVFLYGKSVEVRYKISRPSMVIPFCESRGTLYLQFCFDTFDPNISRNIEVQEEEITPGEIEFL